VVCPQLVQLSVRAQPRDGERRLLAGGHDEVELGGELAQERRQQLVGVRAVERVIVVEHQDAGLGQVCELRRQRRSNGAQRRTYGQTQEHEGVAPEGRIERLQRRDHGWNERRDVAIVLVEGDVGGRADGLPQPGGQQGGLAVAGRRGDQGELAVEPSLEASEQRGASDQVGRNAGRQEFGTEGVGRGLQGRGRKHLVTLFFNGTATTE